MNTEGKSKVAGKPARQCILILLFQRAGFDSGLGVEHRRDICGDIVERLFTGAADFEDPESVAERETLLDRVVYGGNKRIVIPEKV